MSTGTVNFGGPIATGGGLVFAAAAVDSYLRAFDSKPARNSGNVESRPAARPLPMTNTLKGQQYVVIAAGGTANWARSKAIRYRLHAPLKESNERNVFSALAYPQILNESYH